MNDWEITLVAEAQRGNSKCFEELYGLYHWLSLGNIKAKLSINSLHQVFAAAERR